MPLDKDLLHPTASAVHADAPRALIVRKRLRREPAPLAGVEYLRGAEPRKRLLKRIDAEGGGP